MKRLMGILFVLVCLVSLSAPAAVRPASAQAAAAKRLVVFEGFYRSTDQVNSLMAAQLVNGTLTNEFASWPVLFLGYEYDSAEVMAPERIDRFLTAQPNAPYLPLVMTDSGIEAFGGVDSPDLAAQYRSMINAELNVPAYATFTAKYQRVGNHLRVKWQMINQSGVTLNHDDNGATVHLLVYEQFKDTTRPADILTNTMVRTSMYGNIQSLADGAMTYGDWQTEDLSGVNWDNLRVVMLSDAVSKSGPYITLQAYALDPYLDKLIAYKVTPDKLNFQIDIKKPADQSASLAIASPSTTLNWQVYGLPKWLTVTPTSGKGAANLTVKAIASRLSPGTTTGTLVLQMTDNGMSEFYSAPLLASYQEIQPGLLYVPLVFNRPFFEAEPNNTLGQAQLMQVGSLRNGYPDDPNDYFYFEVSAPVNLKVTLENYAGGGVQLLLYYQDASKEIKKAYGAPPYVITLPNAPAGRYYVRIYSEKGWNKNSIYTLLVSAY